MSWRSGSASIKKEVDRLRVVFEDEYHFETEEFLIPEEEDDPHREFLRKIEDFEGPGKQSLSTTLFIFYYAGHGSRDEDTGLHLWKAKNTINSSSLDADSAITHITERSRARSFDTLFLLDCCDPVPRKIQRRGRDDSVCEMIAACADMKALEAGDDSFTNLLINQLYVASRWPRPFNTLELYDNLVTRSQNPELKPKYRAGGDDDKDHERLDSPTPPHIVHENRKIDKYLVLYLLGAGNEWTLANYALRTVENGQARPPGLEQVPSTPCLLGGDVKLMSPRQNTYGKGTQSSS
ncbi:hypothetical protein N0V82_008605 [Gnomoniopsis sp. IMI 355080]|nr:hypothetical protein N0V82_008605 [Gnomoniopsis sp. IMI 355080]